MRWSWWLRTVRASAHATLIVTSLIYLLYCLMCVLILALVSACDCTASTFLCIHCSPAGKGRCSFCHKPLDEISVESYTIEGSFAGGYSLPSSSKIEDVQQCIYYLQQAIRILEQQHARGGDKYVGLLPPVKLRLAVCFYFVAQVCVLSCVSGYLCR